ncbi:MAG TPA: hypothetical protein VF498_07685 [Anaerolineales bacterium]
MGKIFVRERVNVGKGAGRPRFAIVAVEGADLKVYQTHIRKVELEKLAADIGAEVVYLPRGEQSEGEDWTKGSGGRKGRRRRGRGERRD